MQFLNEQYGRAEAQFIPIYGRRRVGKTELIKQFVKNKEHFYFLAKKQDMQQELLRFKNNISRKFNVFLEKNGSWEELFLEIRKKVIDKHERLILVIDEFPYWIEKDEAIVSEFQYIFDEILKDTNCFLILCGSSVGMMETEVLGHRSPLYGRRTGQLKIDTMPFRDFCRFFPKWPFEEVIKAYGALDGVPFYIKEFDVGRSFIENVESTFWRHNSLLNEEAEILLKEELREVNRYLTILKALHDGAAKLNDIAAKSYVDITNINKYLNTLTKLRFIKKEYPVTIQKPKQKNYVYTITDNFFKFWLTYVYPYQGDIAIGELGFLRRLLGTTYNTYLGNIFEEICGEFLSRTKGELPAHFTKMGRWWYKDKEIDLLALNEESGEIMFIECKWKDEVNAKKIVEELREKSKNVKWHEEKRHEHFCIIARSFRQRIKEKDVLLFDLKDIEAAFKRM